MEQDVALKFDLWRCDFASRWKQGQHVAIIGPTGRGKTTLASHILDIREYVVVLAVKKNDDTLHYFRKQGYRTIKKWPPLHGNHKVLLWIKPKTIDEVEDQQERVHQALADFYIEGGWCVYIDEVGYVSGFLKQSRPLGVLLNQGRSSHITMVCSMTRPRSTVASIPLETISQCRHLMIFKYHDEREIEICAKIGGISFKKMIEYHQYMTDHQFLYCTEGLVTIVDEIEQRG
jgi:energy-coupling factor transporter ATP-binding protein EcfA2